VRRSERYWRIRAPSHASEGRAIFVNGRVRHRFVVPGIDCPQGDGHGGSRILTVECPATLQRLTHVRSVWPIPPYPHFELRRRLEAELQVQGHRISLRPGDHFQPAEVRFAAQPLFDFFWPGGPYFVASARTRQVFREREFRGVEFCPALVRCIGQSHPFAPVPLPDTGNAEEIFEVIERETDLDKFGTFYEMVVTAESRRAHGIKIRRCSICGYERIRYGDKKRKFVLTEDMLPDADVFYLADTLYVIVTDEVRRAIVDSQLSNAEFTEMWRG